MPGTSPGGGSGNNREEKMDVIDWGALSPADAAAVCRAIPSRAHEYRLWQRANRPVDFAAHLCRFWRARGESALDRMACSTLGDVEAEWADCAAPREPDAWQREAEKYGN